MPMVPTILPNTANVERDRAGDLAALDRALELELINLAEHHRRLQFILRPIVVKRG
jgi:hypothetical protein